MRGWANAFVVLAAAGWAACGGAQSGRERSPAEPLPATAVTQGRLATPPPLPPTQAGVVPTACGYEPPPILTPAANSIVSQQVTISSPLVEGPCNISATIVFMVANSSGTPVRTGCDNDLPAHVNWDTTQVPNGQYWITAQRACSCKPCAEYSYVGVTVANH